MHILVHTFMVVHLSCRGLAGSVKIVHMVSEWEFTRLEFITKGGGEEGL
jgi:hypothetical protein